MPLKRETFNTEVKTEITQHSNHPHQSAGQWCDKSLASTKSPQEDSFTYFSFCPISKHDRGLPECQAFFNWDLNCDGSVRTPDFPSLHFRRLHWELSKGHQQLPEMGVFLLAELHTSSEVFFFLFFTRHMQHHTYVWHVYSNYNIQYLPSWA